MQISAKDVDDTVHHEAAASRRSFLRGAGIAGIGGTLLVTGGGLSTLTGLGGVAGAQAEVNDPLLAAFGQSIELAILHVYETALPKLPAELRPLVTELSDHHRDYAAALGDLAGENVQTEGNSVLLEQLAPTLADMEEAAPGDELTTAILQVLRELENQAVYTYVAAVGQLKDANYSALMATILPVEAQHATVLSITLEEAPGTWFPTQAFESAEIGDGSDPLRGFAPMTFVTADF